MGISIASENHYRLQLYFAKAGIYYEITVRAKGGSQDGYTSELGCGCVSYRRSSGSLAFLPGTEGSVISPNGSRPHPLGDFYATVAFV